MHAYGKGNCVSIQLQSVGHRPNLNQLRQGCISHILAALQLRRVVVARWMDWVKKGISRIKHHGYTRIIGTYHMFHI
jgi:hypothetical protein